MHWVLQSNLFVENAFRDLTEQLERQNISYDVVKIVPFVGDIEPDVDPEGSVFVCGSTAMKKLAERKQWSPGYIDKNVDMYNVLMNWHRNVLNNDGYIDQIGHIPRLWDRFHIRPVDDKKSFAGAVMDWQEFEEWRDKIKAMGKEENSLGTMDIDTPVIISSVKEIYAEYRFFIVKDRIITHSQYKRGSLVQYKPEQYTDDHIKLFVSAMISPMSVDYWSPCDAYVMDVADTPNGPKIIELNSINSAGFYACDMGKFVAAIKSLG